MRPNASSAGLDPGVFHSQKPQRALKATATARKYQSECEGKAIMSAQRLAEGRHARPRQTDEDWARTAFLRFAETEQNFAALKVNVGPVIRVARVIERCLRAGGKVMFCGNGGSAADAQHLAAELMGRFLADRAPLASVALTVDTSALTAIGNDYGFENVFARQVRGLGRPGDVLVGISTSGSSANVVAAFEAAHEIGIETIALTGGGGGKMALIARHLINAPSLSTPRIQELHIAIGHTICELVEDALT
jgi:D-sedoheptulose 7-phosphate isomerase